MVTVDGVLFGVEQGLVVARDNVVAFGVVVKAPVLMVVLMVVLTEG